MKECYMLIIPLSEVSVCARGQQQHTKECTDRSMLRVMRDQRTQIGACLFQVTVTLSMLLCSVCGLTEVTCVAQCCLNGIIIRQTGEVSVCARGQQQHTKECTDRSMLRVMRDQRTQIGACLFQVTVTLSMLLCSVCGLTEVTCVAQCCLNGIIIRQTGTMLVTDCRTITILYLCNVHCVILHLRIICLPLLYKPMRSYCEGIMSYATTC